MDRVAEPYRLPDVQSAAGELMNRRWIVIQYEAYGMLDRGEWNAELILYLDDVGVFADVIDLPEKNVCVVVNLRAIPTLAQVVESVAAIEHHRFTGRPIRDELSVKTGRA